MRLSKRAVVLALLFVAVLVAVLLYVRFFAPAMVTRLLPECDAIVYLDVASLRAATHFERNRPVPSAAYQQFIDGTGIVAERDLNQVALAMHAMVDANGPNGPAAFSEVFSARFDQGRLERYLTAASTNSTENASYAGHAVYAIATEGRTIRVSLLDNHTIAVSNAPTAEQIHSMIDRGASSIAMLGGPVLLKQRYGDVPKFSPAWAVGHLGLPFANGPSGKIAVMGLDLPMSANTTFVASLRYTTALHLRLEELTATEADAMEAADSLNRLLVLGKTFAHTDHSASAHVQGAAKLLNSVMIAPVKDRAVVQVELPADLLKQLSH